MTDQLTKKLKELVTYLPEDEYKASFSLKATGEQLVKKFPDLTLIPGGILDTDTTYVLRDPRECESNHFRRMKRAYEKSGKDGVVNYFMKYTNKGAENVVKERITAFL